jgi:hypothetical protein
MHAHRARSYLFTLRFWPEEAEGGRVDWRGKLQQVSSGETIYFRDWEALVGFLHKTLGTSAGADGSVFDFARGKGQVEPQLQREPTGQGRDDDEASL